MAWPGWQLFGWVRLGWLWQRKVPTWLAGWLGEAGERAAARFLRRQGMRILASRVRSRLGEIDLIARDGECLVFVEVKTRRGLGAGHPVEAVTARKQAQLARVALGWMKRFGRKNQRARIDVVAVIWPESSRTPEIVHYRNAFEVPLEAW